MTKIELLEYLTRMAKEYRSGCAASVIRNRHMNETNGECNADQNTIDAILVDFINRIGVDQHVDYGLYTRDLN
jgi:hypothetical protein